MGLVQCLEDIIEEKMPLQHQLPYHSALNGKGVLQIVVPRSLVHIFSDHTMKFGQEHY